MCAVDWYDRGMKAFAKMVAFSATLAAVVGIGQTTAAPVVPDAIKAPSGDQVVLMARGSGVQIYTCTAGAGIAAIWVLKEPQAVLSEAKGAAIGRHLAGPTWELKDGSSITGKAQAHTDSPDADAVPWLLVNVTGHSGSGALDRVSAVQRINTKGGKAPATGCDAAHLNSEIKVDYSADYYFYAPAK